MKANSFLVVMFLSMITFPQNKEQKLSKITDDMRILATASILFLPEIWHALSTIFSPFRVTTRSPHITLISGKVINQM